MQACMIVPYRMKGAGRHSVYARHTLDHTHTHTHTRIIGVGAGQVGPVLTGPLFRKKLVGVTTITINTCVLVRAAAACSASG